MLSHTHIPRIHSFERKRETTGMSRNIIHQQESCFHERISFLLAVGNDEDDENMKRTKNKQQKISFAVPALTFVTFIR
jgi:hypothetical protein